MKQMPKLTQTYLEAIGATIGPLKAFAVARRAAKIANFINLL